MISVEAKKEFLRWFLKRYQLKRRECVWILNYLISHEKNLENVSFTDDALHCPRALVISTSKSSEIPFRFYRGTMMTADPEKTYNDMSRYENEKLYIQLNYPDKHKCSMYATVFEDNDFLVNTDVDKSVKQDAEKLIIEMEERLIGWSFNTLINMALDEGDNKAFMRWTEESKKMGEEMT